MEEGLWWVISKDGLVALIPTCAFKGQGSFDQWNVLEGVPSQSLLRPERLKVPLLLSWTLNTAWVFMKPLIPTPFC